MVIHAVRRCFDVLSAEAVIAKLLEILYYLGNMFSNTFIERYLNNFSFR